MLLQMSRCACLLLLLSCTLILTTVCAPQPKSASALPDEAWFEPTSDFDAFPVYLRGLIQGQAMCTTPALQTVPEENDRVLVPLNRTGLVPGWHSASGDDVFMKQGEVGMALTAEQSTTRSWGTLRAELPRKRP